MNMGKVFLNCRLNALQVCRPEMASIIRSFVLSCALRERPKFMGYPGRVYRQGGGDFFQVKKKRATFFQGKVGGRTLFFLGSRTFFLFLRNSVSGLISGHG